MPASGGGNVEGKDSKQNLKWDNPAANAMNEIAVRHQLNLIPGELAGARQALRFSDDFVFFTAHSTFQQEIPCRAMLFISDQN